VYETINLGESQVITLNEMLSGIEKELGKSCQKKSANATGRCTKNQCRYKKAKNLINYLPKTNYQNGIKIFVEWFLRNNN
jgi:UDP-glucuronate 4-epimerase